MTTEEAKEKYSKEIPEHRVKGDLLDYLWEEVEKEHYNGWILAGYEHKVEERLKKNVSELENIYPIEFSIIRPFLLDDELDDFEKLFEAINCCGKTWEGRLTRGWEEGRYLLSLALAEKDSFEYKRYLKIRSRIQTAQHLKELDECIKKREKQLKLKKLEKYGAVILVAIVLIIIGVLVVIKNLGKSDNNNNQYNGQSSVEKYELKKIN